MDYKVGHGTFEVFQSIPDEYKSFALHNSPGELIVTDFLKLFAHPFPGTGYVAGVVDYLCYADGSMGAEEDKPLLEFRCSMKNRLEGTWEGLGNAGLPDWHFNLSYAAHIETNAIFRKGHHWRVFAIHLQRAFFEKFRVQSPALGHFLDKVDAKQPIELSPYPFPCTRPMRQAIYGIINNPFNDQFSLHARDEYVNFILETALQRILFPDLSYTIVLLAHQQDALFHVKKLIEENLDHPFTNEQLCKKVMITDEVLRVGFRQLFGTTPYDYYMELKFIEAERALMKRDKPINAIAYSAGYARQQHFAKEFKKRYKCTASEFRQQYGR